MSQRSGVVLFLTLGLAAVLASACGEDGDDGGGAGTSGSAGTNAGSAGKGGSSGSSGESGGTGGSSGASGSGSGTAGTSGKGGAGGVSGSSGKGGGAGKGGSSGAPGQGGGDDTADCEIVQCLRPVDCVEVCGGPVLKSSCCPCDEGTFDNFECDGSGGGASRRGFGGSPGEASGGAGGSFDLSDLNSDCVDDACSDGLTPIHYYGVAGPGGPEFCSCSIPCEFGPNDCPEGTTCVNVSDGPGNVCWN